MFAYVKFKIESGFYAEFINELIEKEIYIKNIRYNDLTVTAVCKARDYKEVAKLGKKFGCRVRKIKKYGFYYETRPILNRKGIVAAAIIFVLLTIVYDQTVWKININTDNEELKNAVMNQMIENEVFIGKFYNKEKFEQTAKKIVQNCDGVGYATLNFYRGILNCNIYTSIKAEEYIKDQTNDVILANADGIIKDIRVYRGYSDNKAGDTVCKGNVLVTNFHEKSGVFYDSKHSQIADQSEHQHTFDFFLFRSRIVHAVNDKTKAICHTGRKHNKKQIFCISGKVVQIAECEQNNPLKLSGNHIIQNDCFYDK